MTTPGNPSQKLDDETERRIRELKSKLRDWAVIWEKGEVSADPSLDAVLDAEDALRLRIAQLISEARAEGAQGNSQPQHRYSVAYPLPPKRSPDDR